MDLVPWNPFRDLENWSRDVTNFFDHPARAFGGMYSPRVDVFQTDKDVIVKAEIPGVGKEDLNLYVDENSVRISGQIKREKDFKDENIYRTERHYGSFSRSVPLPEGVKAEEAQAKYNDGILTITIPKMEPSKHKGRKIDIN